MPDHQPKSRSLSKILLQVTLAFFSLTLAIMGGIIAYIWLFNADPDHTPAQAESQTSFNDSVAVAEPDSSVEMDTANSDTEEQALAQTASQEDQALSSNITPNPIQPKPIRASAHNRARWTPTPMPTSTPLPTPSPIPTFVGELPNANFEFPTGVQPGEKWIDVNLTSQTLVAYEGSTPVYRSLVSSGTNRNPTVTGQFRIWLRFASQDMNGYRLGYDYFLQDVPFVQYFFEDYALHGTYWHNNFGTQMSHGCVNLPTPAAEWLFHWASNGTLVNIHS